MLDSSIREKFLAAVLAVVMAVKGKVQEFKWTYGGWFRFGHHKGEQLMAGDSRAQGFVSQVVTAGILGIAIIILILVYSEVEVALPTPTNSDLHNASNNSTDTFASAMELAPLIILVLIAGLILAVVQNFR